MLRSRKVLILERRELLHSPALCYTTSTTSATGSHECLVAGAEQRLRSLRTLANFPGLRECHCATAGTGRTRTIRFSQSLRQRQRYCAPPPAAGDGLCSLFSSLSALAIHLPVLIHVELQWRAPRATHLIRLQSRVQYGAAGAGRSAAHRAVDAAAAVAVQTAAAAAVYAAAERAVRPAPSAAARDAHYVRQPRSDATAGIQRHRLAFCVHTYCKFTNWGHSRTCRVN